MKEKGNIDEFFKNKFSDLGNPDAASDWQKMEKMLDNSKPIPLLTRKRIIIGILLICSSLFIIFKISSNQKLAKNNSHISPIVNNQATPSFIEKNKLSQNKNSILKRDSSKSVVNPIHRKKNPLQEPTNIVQENKVEKLKGLIVTEAKKLKTNIKNLKKLNSSILNITPKLLKTNGQEQAATERIKNKLVIVTTPKPKTSVSYFALKNEIDSLNNISLTNYKKAHLPKFTIGLIPSISYVKYQRDKLMAKNIVSEKTLSSFNYGIGAYLKYNNWQFEIGVNHLTLNEKTNYQKSSYTSSYDTSFALVKRYYEVSEHGKNIALVKKIITSTIDTIEDNSCAGCKVKFTYLHIPLNIQYEVGRNRLKFYGQVGLGVFLLQKAQGVYSVRLQNKSSEIERTYTIKSLTKKDVNKTLFNSSIALGIKYRITPAIGIFTSFNYRVYHSSIMAAYKQVPTLQALRLGFEIRLN